jgi:hypothetical protein
MTEPLLNRTAGNKNILVFAVLWLLTFAIYIPAAKAGWVIDAIGFIHNLRHESFWDFINRVHSEDHSLYQLFTFHYYLFYKLWGMNLWLWSLLYITVQSLNAFLLFLVCKNIFSDTGIKNSMPIALCGALLFTVCPHISEVVVCKAYYHYLQCFFFILLIVLWVQKYQHEQKAKYVWGTAILFALASITLEIFYLIPALVVSLALYYRYVLKYDQRIFKKTLINFFAVQAVILGLYFVLLYARYGQFTAHKITFNEPAIQYLSKPLKYVLHILFLGRYFSPQEKKQLYGWCESFELILVFYTLVLTIFLFAVMKLNKLTNVQKGLLLLFVWAALFIAFILPMPFPDAALLVFYDRYTYFVDGFIYTFLALLVGSYVNKYVSIALLCLYAGVNLYFTVKLNLYWKHSAYITNRLLHDLPPADNKIVVLLNVPENMNGVPMIGAQPESEFKVMDAILNNVYIKNPVYDAVSYNMMSETDGAHVTVANDSVLHVTLNQWGTWWWYEGHGAKSYETNEYSLNMIDEGHWYELKLKKPASQYLLLFQTGDQWRVVDMNKKNVDQY